MSREKFGGGLDGVEVAHEFVGELVSSVAVPLSCLR